MYRTLAVLLSRILGTDQSYHAQQKKDGTYRRTPGAATPTLLEKTFKSEGSIAIYQKNIDLTIKWICIDFDILKVNLDSHLRASAQEELERVVINFCNSLSNLGVPYLLEFSGNRGFHVWITFNEKVGYLTGYEIHRTLLDITELSHDGDLVGIDFFPASRTPTDGVGMGVKVPLSKHTKSGGYAYLLSSVDEVPRAQKVTSVTEELVRKNINILNSHKSTSKHELESLLDVLFDSNHDENLRPTRIKNISVTSEFGLRELMAHWSGNDVLDRLVKKIVEVRSVSHEERKILVGILFNIRDMSGRNFGESVLHKIFSTLGNYDKEITDKSIKKLSSFNFPSQEQIENAVQHKFSEELNLQQLLTICIPKFSEYEDASFDICKADIEIVKIAELTYLFLNDEAQSKLVINELASNDSYRLLKQVEEVLGNKKSIEFYSHIRNEGNKTRELITLRTAERMASSCILKQLIYFLDFQPSGSSHGYKPNNGFSGGYIFQPWLYLWIKFVSNISEAIENVENKNFYIVKTDIKRFYDSIPHDNVKRLLLGGVNSRVDGRLSGLSSSSKITYNSYIETLFGITEKIRKSKIGFPQGPAYCRFLAELYLDNLDEMFDQKIGGDDILLYQRYVDDIFFVAPSEEKAKETLQKLKVELELLGLEINNEKTIVAKIQNFSEEFDRYRSQSKYAVDSVSKNYSDSTDTQKNAAITEFMNLVHSDTCDDDLAFIFSHLTGVAQLDEFKRGKVAPTILSGIGRGSLYKHLFSFVLNSQENWVELENIGSFNALQSEVLTASLIVALESDISVASKLKEFIPKLELKLTKTDLVFENLIFLLLIHDVDIDFHVIPSAVIINCLKTIPISDDISVPVGLVQHLDIELNNIKSLADFVEAIYPLCASSKVSKDNLNDLAGIYYAKILVDYRDGNFSVDSYPMVNTPSAAAKYYYLLCLFSISNKNKSSDLLIESWKFCAHIFNTIDAEVAYKTSDWFNKIKNIEYNPDMGLLIVSSIVDGNIFRGLEDRRGVFERFHNLILIFLTLQVERLSDPHITEKINSLKDKGFFYRWLIERDNTRLFPTASRPWFEKNVIENSAIILKKGNQVLFRKPSNSFHASSNPVNELNGYSEILVDYSPADFHNIFDILSGDTLISTLERLINVIDSLEYEDAFPNIFSSEPMLHGGSTLPFSIELMNLKMLIVEDRVGNIESLQNNKINFIKSFVNSASAVNNNLLTFRQKYIDNLDDAFNIVDFVRNLLAQLRELDQSQYEFHLDIAAAAAISQSLSDFDVVRRIDWFVNQYHKFNKHHIDRHVYAINNNTNLLSATPSDFFDSILSSIRLISDEIAPAITLYLHKDVEKYMGRLNELLAGVNLPEPLKLNDFKRVYPRVSPVSESLNIDGAEYNFSKVRLFNATTNDVHIFEARHSGIITLSEHVYIFESVEALYIIAMSSSLSKIYGSIEKRLAEISHNTPTFKSYPTTLLDQKDILELNTFHAAVDVICQHQDIEKSKAKEILVKWLSSIPRRFRQPVTTLISSHVVMSDDDINRFIGKVESLLSDKYSNPFLIKKITDYNGTHRLLYKRYTIGRSIESLSPLSISKDAKRATIIVDVIITGSQIISSLKFYITGIKEKSVSQNYLFSEEDRNTFLGNLKRLDSLDICTIFYTKSGIANIENELRKFIDPMPKINIINGIDIEEKAYFGTTIKIGEQEKDSIRNILSNEVELRDLYAHLEIPYVVKLVKSYSAENIDKINLVARYQSLPKKCFDFLRGRLKNDAKCFPLMRIPELNERN